VIVRSLRRGFTETARLYRITLVLYLANLAAAAVLAAPMAVLIDESFGRSLSGLDLASSFRFEAIVDFLQARRDAIASHFQVLGFGLLLYATLSAVLTGGMIDALKSPPRSPFLPRFLGGCGRFAFRFLRLIPYLGAALAGVYWINRSLNQLIVLAFDQSAHEIAAFWVMRGKQGLVLAILLLLTAVFDVAWILSAFVNRCRMSRVIVSLVGLVERLVVSILALYAVLLAARLFLFSV